MRIRSRVRTGIRTERKSCRAEDSKELSYIGGGRTNTGTKSSPDAANRPALSSSGYPSVSPSRCSEGSGRQHTPYRCHSRNHGLCASISSCLRLAAEMSLAVSGRMSGASNISCICSISSMMRSTSMGHNHLGKRGDGSTRWVVGVS
jgi:hypothetical protein